MQTRTPVSLEAVDDEIDLRQLIETLLKWKWLIVGLVVVAVAAAGIVSYAVLPPKYESSLVLDLSLRDAGELRLDPTAYEALAASNQVWEAMIRLGGLDMTPAQLEEMVTVKLNQGAGLLTVTGSAQTPAEAQRLAGVWYDAFAEELVSYAQERIGQMVTVAERDLVEWERRLGEARGALNAFDSQVLLPVLEARLERLQSELVDAEARLRDLTQNAIPADEARLHALETALADQPEVLGENTIRIVLPVVEPEAGVTGQDVTMLNPVYLQLSQDLVATRTRLLTNRRAAELLQEQVERLPGEIERLRSDLIGYQEERSRLTREVDAFEPLVEQARARRDSLLALQRSVQDVVVPPVVADPPLPERPVAPRKLLNMALAGFLAAFVGVVTALFLEFWFSDPRERLAPAQEIGR